ncbi:hypothetical protein Acr_23g0000280 [Actinidia rufa]|uniref:Uncharacterized protein n=1 Tax=Actinidia rufa TaxID=165716 RepID=A0A7J0GLG1_9ERIC|nr:hypothetical protein Acr_23g0000280 [Actinidia rufa]
MGSERLLQLVSDSSESQNSSVGTVTRNNSHGDSEDEMHDPSSPWVLQPSEELEKLVQHGDADHGLNQCILSDICKTFDLNTMAVVKYRDSV